MEDVLCGTCAKDPSPQGLQQLPAGGADITADEDPGEAGPWTPPAPCGPSMDPLQFAYQPDIGMDDAVNYLLQRSLSLEKAGGAL